MYLEVGFFYPQIEPFVQLTVDRVLNSIQFCAVNRNLFIFLSFLCSFYSTAYDRKHVDVHRVSEEIKIDGQLDESFWKGLPEQKGFYQSQPLAGQNSTANTAVKIAYDDNAIYVGFINYDDRDSMTTTLSQRDDQGNADWCGIVIDPYNAGTIGFAFYVTSAGVQVDELHSVESTDRNWNAVWRSAVSIHDDKWIAEFKIPFSAIRFSEENDKPWGVNFARTIRRKREQTYWNYNDPAGLNLISQLGELEGIQNVNSPLRLAFSPYVSGYLEHNNGSIAKTANGGMDVKWGVNEAFTIDMTLVPDFGQVQFDNQVLNTSPFEVRFNERRQFFTEGTELFNKPSGVFYSRRVGGRPLHASAIYAETDSNEVVVSNPSTTRLLNATKFSGRTKSGTGIGVFNAITADTYGEIRDTVSGEERFFRTNPLSNYNLFVIDQNLKNNSSVSLTNTNVWRAGSSYDANVVSLIADIYTKEQKFNYWGIGNVSKKFYDDSLSWGHSASIGLEKSAGAWTGGLVYQEISNTYDPNDLGFNLITNVWTISISSKYSWFEPFGRFNRAWVDVWTGHKRITKPDAFADYSFNIELGGAFKDFTWAGANLYAEPLRQHDYFESRISGRHYVGDALIAPGMWVSTDFSKPYAFEGRGTWYQYFEDQRNGFDLTIENRIRFNDKWYLIQKYNQNNAWNEEGVALTQDFDIVMDPDHPDDPIFAKRDRVTVTNTIDLSYIMTNKMGITFRMRHYWSKLDYNELFRLNTDGIMVQTNYLGLNADDVSVHDNSFNAFTIDMVYRWIFAPGSELSIVWKNSIFSFDDQLQNNYIQNVNGLFQNQATNSISLKILYYIDYWSVHQKIFKKS
jgi:hypothetical protein